MIFRLDSYTITASVSFIEADSRRAAITKWDRGDCAAARCESPLSWVETASMISEKPALPLPALTDEERHRILVDVHEETKKLLMARYRITRQP